MESIVLSYFFFPSLSVVFLFDFNASFSYVFMFQKGFLFQFMSEGVYYVRDQGQLALCFVGVLPKAFNGLCIVITDVPYSFLLRLFCTAYYFLATLVSAAFTSCTEDTFSIFYLC